MALASSPPTPGASDDPAYAAEAPSTPYDEVADTADEEEEEEPGARMTFLEHLEELRKRLLHALLGILVGFVLSFTFIQQIYDFIMRPLQQMLPKGGMLIYTEPTEAFFLYLKIAALAGLVLASPWVLWQVWLFVAPGLYSHEKRFAIPFVLLSTIFFVAGALFSHYVVFPVAWRFFASFSTDYMLFMPKIQSVFSLYVKMLLAFGLIFQLPTLVFFLARMGVVTPRLMIRYFKYAVLVAFIAAAVLTPTPDAVTQTLMAVPIILLYLISVVIAWIFQKRPAAD